MKLHRLELEGFGPFLERQVVDFDAFADDGIFLIAGRTGPGSRACSTASATASTGAFPAMTEPSGVCAATTADSTTPRA